MPNEPYVVVQDSPRVVAGRQNGQRGGFARAEIHGPERRKEWARLGGIATRTRHGNEFFREISKVAEKISQRLSGTEDEAENTPDDGEYVKGRIKSVCAFAV